MVSSRLARVRRGLAPAALAAVLLTSLASPRSASAQDSSSAAAHPPATHADRVPVHMVSEGAPPKHETDIPTPAWPLAEDGEDVVLLKDGGMVRGYLEELLPGERARIRLVSGDVSVIPWKRIDHVEQGKGPQRPPASPPLVLSPAPAAAPSPAPAPPAVAGEATVHIAGGDVTLFQQNGSSWRSVCTTPCDQPLPLDGYYRLGGEGVRASKIFRLVAKPGERVVLTVKTASSTGHGAGVVLVILSGAMGSIAYLGLVGSVDSRHGSGAAEAWGLTFLGAGVVAIGGIGLLVAHDHTDLGQRVQRAHEPAGADEASASTEGTHRVAGGAKGRVEERLPAWRSSQRDLATPEVPRAVSAPVFGLVF